jgi:hypothetical protein
MNRFTHRSVLAVLGLAAPFTLHAAKAEKKDPSEARTPANAFALMDRDGNGAVSLGEYVAAERDRVGDGAAKTRFAELDKNHDGALTRAEFGVRDDRAGQRKGKRPFGRKKNAP